MRKISANYIFPVNGKPIKNGIIIINDKGIIIDLIDNNGELKESENLEFYNGVIVPGFINVHCHLELSHLRNKIPEGIGMPGFISGVRENRESSNENIINAIKLADEELYRNGIVAVADISNSNISFEIKRKSPLYYHNFIEVFGYNNNDADAFFSHARRIYNSALDYSLSASIVPHSPYSLSEKLFSKVVDNANKQKNIVSIHNQESKGENELFLNRSGKLYDQLKKISEEYKNWIPSGKSSIQTYLQLLPNNIPILLVHNTFTSTEDILYANNLNKELFWVFCPNSNKYIGGSIPNISSFLKFDNSILIGTDSLASNKSLSILDELKTISKEFPNIKLHNLIKWASLNGAKSLKIDNKFGSIEKGKNPGLILLENINMERLVLSEKTTVKRLA